MVDCWVLFHTDGARIEILTETVGICVHLEIWQPALCQNLLQNLRRRIIFLIIITGFHGDCQDPLQAIKACKAILTFSLLSLSLFFSPPRVDRVIMTHACLLTFSCPSFSSLQPRFKGHGFPFFFTSDDSLSCKTRGFYHVQPAVCSGSLAGKWALLSVAGQSSPWGGFCCKWASVRNFFFLVRASSHH